MNSSYQLVAFNEQGKLEIIEEGCRMIQEMKQRHSIVAVTGPYRSGKSFLLNLVMETEGFKVGSRVQACTAGIWVYQIVRNRQSYLFVDVEGFGSTSRSSNDDGKLLALALSVSSLVIYNSIGVINESKINHLSLALTYCQLITSQYKNPSESPHLIWVLRDFILDLVTPTGEKITSSQYLESILNPEAKSKSNEPTKKMRESILSTFPTRACITLPRPVDDEKSLQSLNPSELKPEFHKGLKKLKKIIFSTTAKTINNKFVRGKELVQVIKILVDNLNSEKIPHVPSAWQNIIEQEYENLADQSQEEQIRIISKLRCQIPVDDSIIMTNLQAFKEKVEKLFIDCHFCDETLTRKCISNFAESLDDDLNSLLSENKKACLEFNVNLLNSLFPPLFIAIENNEYENDIDKLEIEWSNLMEQFESRSKGTGKMNAISEFSRRNQGSVLGKMLNDVVLEMKVQVDSLRNQEKMIDPGVEFTGKTNEEIMTEITWNRYKMQELNRGVKNIQKNVLKKL